MRAQWQEALGGRHWPSAALLTSLFLLFGQVSQLPLPLLLKKAFLWEVVVTAEGQAAQGGLQVPAAWGTWGAGGPFVRVFWPEAGENSWSFSNEFGNSFIYRPLIQSVHTSMESLYCNDGLRILLKSPWWLSEMFINALVNTLNAVLKNLMYMYRFMCQLII